MHLRDTFNEILHNVLDVLINNYILSQNIKLK